MLSRTSLTASTASRPLSWASETTLRTFVRAAMARSFRMELCAVKPNVDAKVPAFRLAAEDASLCDHRPALQRRTILSSFGQRVDCDRRGGRTTTQEAAP